MARGASIDQILEELRAAGAFSVGSACDLGRATLEDKVAELASRNVQLNRTVQTLADSTTSSKEPLGLVEQTAQLAASALELSQRTAKLAESNAELLHRTQTLEDANADLKLMMRQREDFTAALTHDLKNPLIGCNGVLQGIITGKFTDDEQKHLLNEVVESHNAMLRMIWNMLDIYKYECGALKPNQTSINLIELLHASLKEFAYVMSEKKQTCKLDVPIALPKLNGDRMLLRRVLINLVGNAVKFTPDKGSIDVKATFDEKSVRLAVEDSGAGIPFAKREHLFKQFWQGDHSQISSVGTGLGLYLSRAIVQAHGGSLECTSGESSGAVFTVTLPRT
jgi:two-component system, sensor histidine kinase and response regulator